MERTDSGKIARIISTTFVPPSFTLIVFTFFAFFLENDPSKRFTVILVSFIFGFSLHILLFLFFRKNGQLVDIDASIKEERTTPFLIAEIFYAIGLIIFIYKHINIISIAFWFCYISNTLIIVLINKYWKISVHAMGSSGPLASIIFVVGPLGIVFILVPIIVGWSRIKLKCHTTAQVLTGALFGFLSTYLQIVLIVKWFSNAR